MTASPISISDAFKATAARFGKAPLLKFSDRSVSFDSMDQQSASIATALQKQGVKKGDRVALYCINSDSFVAAYLGIIRAGAVVVPVNLLISPREVLFILDNADVKGLIYHQAMSAAVAECGRPIADLSFRICIGEEKVHASDLDFASLLEISQQPHAHLIDPTEDLAAILYTSGTTGNPKGAMLTHHNLVSNTRSVVQALQLRPGEDCLLVVLPMFHSFAATVGVLTPLLNGLSSAPVARFDPALISETIAATGATIFLGVPSLYSSLMRLHDEQINDWKTIRYGVSGGAAMPVDLMQRVEQRFNFPIVEGDGPTECSPVTCVNPPDGIRKPASVGLPVPDVEIEIFDAAAQQLGQGEIGEICVRGPNVMKGYWKLPEATAETFYGDWVRTGDLGYKDSDGYIFMVDRIKDMIIVNGMNVYPRMVEEQLFTHPQILEAAVVGEPHESHGETVVAHVVPVEGGSLTVAEVKDWCRQRLGQHQRPRKVVIRDSLPKNAAGKVLKRELRKEGELERGIDSR